jgi:hypothetical protein
MNDANPTTWYKKNMLFENFMFNVFLSLNKDGRLEDDPLVLDEEENQHDLFEFPTNDHDKTFHFQDCYLMLTFQNNYHPIMGITAPLHHPTMHRWTS